MSEIQANIDHLIVDWGTTNFRAFAMSADNELLDTNERPLGLLQVAGGDFARALKQVLAMWLDEYEHLPIYMAGMVGSMMGWVNVPYASAPVAKGQLAKISHRFTLPWGAPAVIIPGVCYSDDADRYDVMRGEEVQLFGLAELIEDQAFNAIFPGTHSKHIHFESDELQSFSSYLTGEFHSVLLKHSLLGKGVSKTKEFNQMAFLKGVEDSKDGALSNRIFLGWTQRLFEQIKPEQVPDYISGLLIGYELRHFDGEHAYLVGGDSLCKLYEIAGNYLSIETETISGNSAFLAGMSVLIEEIQHETSAVS